MSWNQNDLIIVTGGAGFIGSALIWELNARGFENIFVVDALGTDEKWKHLVPLRFNDYLDHADFLHLVEEDDSLLQPARALFHLGACSATTERDADYLMRNNYGYTKTLAHWALQHGVRFTYASSAATYGDGNRGMDDRDPELHRLRPLNMYGYSKHLFDLYAQKKGILDQMVGLKYFNVFGPNEDQKGDMRSVVHKGFEQIQATGKMGLFKSYHPDYRDGEQKRDFLYVKDAVRMTLHLAQSAEAGGLYNVGSGTAQSWLDLAQGLFAALEREPQIEFIEMPAALQAKYQYYTCADIAKLRESGYTDPITPLADAIADTVRAYLLPGKVLGE